MKTFWDDFDPVPLGAKILPMVFDARINGTIAKKYELIIIRKRKT